MRKMTLPSRHWATGLTALALAAGTLGTTGCGLQAADEATAPLHTAGAPILGSVHGGQQPVAGATIQLYGASSAGYGAASYALLTTPSITANDGSFTSIAFNCPSPTMQVYLVATGGNPGSGTNSALALMSVLGPCANLVNIPFVNINEVTTIAGVYALAPFMSGYASVGSSATNAAGLASAFATANKLASYVNGTSFGTLPAGASAPTTEINTLGNIIASCVNSTGPGSTTCTGLFTNTTPAGSPAPTDTIGAALNIAKYPGSNVSALLALNSPAAPFQPSLSSATDYTVTIKYKPTVTAPTALAVSSVGDVWVASTNNTLARLDATTGASTIYSGGGLSGPSALAFDQSGNAWVTNKTNSSLSVFTPAGAGTAKTFPGSMVSSPTGIAINGSNQLWVTNSGNNTLFYGTISGTTLSSSGTVTPAGLNLPAAIAINPY